MFRRLLGVAAILVSSWRGGAAWAAGPELEDVPTRRVAGELPAPATWPALRHERTLRTLVITWKGRSLAGYQRICRRVRASWDVRYTNGADARYHVNDKWIEPQGDPTDDELTAHCRQLILDATDPARRPLPYDVIFYDHSARLLQDATLQRHLLAFVEAGGVLAVCGSEYPAADAPLAAAWPARPKPQHSWMPGGSQRADGPELAGVPVERLTGHTWIPLAEPAIGGHALADGEAGAMYVRACGRGHVLLVPTGPLSRSWNLHAKLGGAFDHDEIWLRAWDQVLHSLCGGPEAIPVCTDLRAMSQEDAAGQDFQLTGRVLRRAPVGALVASLHVTSPLGHVVYRSDVPLMAAADPEQDLSLAIPVAASWGAGLYPVYLTLGDATSQRQVHQALAYLPVRGTVQLTLAADKPGYRLGETVRFAATASSSTPWQGRLRLGVFDFRGRLLFADDRPAEFGLDARQFAFAWPLADHGVRVDTLWAVLAAEQDGAEFARAETRFAKHEPWDMRAEYQWSTWAALACGNPCAVPAGMRLMAHAGMNSLGYPGRSELYAAAERWGWRYYNEGLGMNTFSPVIEYENDAEIEAHLLQEIAGRDDARDLTSAAFVLGSVGEEAGYKHGWGTKYYWDTPVAPDKACRALQWYLKTRYGELAKLNATWRTSYRSWDEIKLTREFSGRTPALAADGWAHPKESPLGAETTAVSLAPYFDTEHFYAWYYDRLIAAAQRIFRERVNPVTRTMASAPASWVFNSRECNARLAGPGAWNESQTHSLSDGPEPAFSLVWGHFDWSIKTENLFWGFLLQRSGHNNFWVDVPLMFNNDLSHTRASLAMRRWTSRLAGHERLLLDSRPAPTDVGVLPHNGISANLTPANMDSSLRVALLQAGFGYAVADPAALDKFKVVFAPARQSVSRAEAERIRDYVERGGTLVFTARFANQDEFGAPQPVCPGAGLAEPWSFAVVEKQDAIPQYGQNAGSPIPLDGVDRTLAGLALLGRDVYREKVRADGWTTLASYADETPAILTRTVGRGRLVYVNAVYQSHWYIQWVTPTDSARQAFFRLVEWLCEQAGARRPFRLDGPLDQTLHMAVQQATDPSGAIRYVLVRTSGEVPWTNGRLRWLGGGGALYDVLSGPAGSPARRCGDDVPLNLRPGDGKWLAVLPAALHTVRVTAEPKSLAPGQPLRVGVAWLDEQGRAVPGQFPCEVRVSCGGREIAGLQRSVSLASGGELTIATALSDPAGTWTVTIMDGITGLSGSSAVEATTPAANAGLSFGAHGWPSEIAEPAQVSADEFLDRLRRLTQLYQTDHSDRGWQTKQLLGAHYEFFPGTRHALLRPLFDGDWLSHVEVWRAAIQRGETFVLTGEDLNLDPATGLSISPHSDLRALAAVAAVLRDATWRRGTADGETLIATLGQGRVILCRESIDAAGHTNADVARWQKRWLAELRLDGADLPAVPALDETALRRWWCGELPAGDAPRTITWFAGNHRELTLTLDPAKPLDAVFSLAIPPHGDIVSLDFDVAVKGQGEVTFDVGCDDTADGRLTATGETTTTQARAVLNTPAVAASYLAWRTEHGGPVRDDNGWRIIPVRVRTTGPATVTLSQPVIVCR